MILFNRNPLRLLAVIFLFCFMSVVTSSCSKYNDPVTELQSSAREFSKDAYSRLLSFDCATLSSATLNNTYRNRAISQYGSAIGPWYDSIKNARQTNPSAYSANPSYARIHDYANRIVEAIKKGAKALAESYCTDNTTACNNQVFNSNDLKWAIEVYLQPIRSSLLIDATFTQFEKDVLNNVIQVYYSNFEEITNYATNGLNCFPNPYWYAAGGLVSPLGIFSGIGKALRKVVNIAATILTAVVENAVYGALYGAIIGVPFGVSGPGVIVGAVVGGGIGIVDGVNRCFQGNYVCIFACT